MKKALVVGGSSGIGLSLTFKLIEKGYEHVYVVGKEDICADAISESDLAILKEKTTFHRLNLLNSEYALFDQIRDIDTLIITAGFGRVASFDSLTEPEITNLIKCNLLSVTQIIKRYYHKLRSESDFYCAVMGSIAGHVSSPLFSVYGASKAGLCAFLENVNIELAFEGSKNRILDVSPGSIKGTNFSGKGNDLSLLDDLSSNIYSRMMNRETLYIPQYDEVYGDVIRRYREDPAKYGMESYQYKIRGGRVSTKPQVVVGYLSGTFDLFHVGHLNLIRRAKAMCDYLIVGVHKSGSWKGKETYIPFDERVSIVSSIKYVDEVIESFTEDSDAYDALHFNKLFVGSDYKGTERFQRYEKYFEGKNVEIVYFPYTQGTSSTQLRAAISK